MKKTAINMISGGAGYFLPMLINFLATPFLLEKLGNEAYGLQSLVNVILGYLMVADMGLDLPIIRFLAELNAKRDNVGRNKLLSTTFQLYAIIGLSGMMIIFLTEPYLYGLFSIPDNLKPEAKIVFWITGIGFLGNIMSMWGRAVFIGIQRYDIANGIYLMFNLISTVAGIVVVYNDMGIVYFVLAKVIGFFLAAFTYAKYTKWSMESYKFYLGFDKAILHQIKPLIGYGFILRFSGMFFSRLDQSLISAWVSIGAVGIYSIPYLINTALTGFITGIIGFTLPRASELYSTNQITELRSLFITSVKYTCVIASYFFCFLIVAGDRFIFFWINPEFASQAQQSMLILSIANFVIVIFAAIMNNFLVAMNGMRFFAYGSIIRSSVMAVGFIILIKPMGLAGAASGVLLACLCDIVFFFLFLKRYIKMEFTSIVIPCFVNPLLIGIGSATVIFYVKFLIVDWLTFILSGLCYSGLFLILGIISRVFDTREKEALAKTLFKFRTILSQYSKNGKRV